MIRYMNESDRVLFLGLVDEFYHTTAVLHEVPKENFEHTFRQIVENNPFVRGIILEKDAKQAGYALLSLTYSNEVGGLVVLVEEIFVKPEFRSCGLGKELFEFIEQEFGSTAKRYRLEVTRNNTRAVELYKRMGYEPLDYLQMIRDV